MTDPSAGNIAHLCLLMHHLGRIDVDLAGSDTENTVSAYRC